MKRPPLPAEAPWDLPTHWAVLVLLALPLTLFFPALLGGKMLWGADIQTLALPFNLAVRRALAQGQWPLWMPELLGGMPGVAATNLVFLYPTELALHLLRVPVAAGFGIDAAIHVGLAGLGLYGLARSLGASRAGALLGGMAFALSGSQVSILYAGHINNIKAIAAIPWVFWAAHSAWSGGRWSRWVLCGLALGLQVLAIGMQIYAYTILGLAGFVAWMAWRDGADGKARWGRAAAGLAVAGFFSALFSAPQLLPSLMYKPYSWREGFSYEAFTSWSFAPKEALGWLVPGFYGWREPTYHGDWPFCLSSEYFGVLAWALAAAALAGAWTTEAWRARLRRPEAFFLALALFSFLAGIGKYFPLNLVFYHLPVYNGFRSWTRFLTLLTAAFCVLAALGWDALFRAEGAERARKAARVWGGLAVAAALFAMAACTESVLQATGGLVQKLGQGGPAQALDLARGSAYKAGTLGVALVLLFGARHWLKAPSVLLLCLLLGIQAVDAGEVPWRYLEFRDPATLLQPPALCQDLPAFGQAGPYRVLDLPGVFQQNGLMIQGVEQMQGYHGVQMAAPMRLQQALQARQMDWIDLCGARYVVSQQPVGLPGGRVLNPGQSPVLMENPHALPRAFLVGRSRSVAGDDAAYAALADPAWHPENEAVLVDGPALAGGGFRTAPVQWETYSANASVLAVACAAPSVLVLAQTWYPGWKATVDGRPQALLKADGAFSALALGPGQHRIGLRYTEPALAWGALACALACLALGLLLWSERRRA